MGIYVWSSTPLSPRYRPDLDALPGMSPIDISYFQLLIGVLRWGGDMGRICITCGDSMISSNIAIPHVGHLQQVYHIFGYLSQHHNSRLFFDPPYPIINKDAFWKFRTGDMFMVMFLRGFPPMHRRCWLRGSLWRHTVVAIMQERSLISSPVLDL